MQKLALAALVHFTDNVLTTASCSVVLNVASEAK